MHVNEERTVQCPYCWQMIDINVDCSIPEQDYIEDCEVCCQAIRFQTNTQHNDLQLQISREGA